MSNWQTTPLGEILYRSNEIAEVRPDESYKEITVKLWGKGVVLRRIANGAELNGSRRFLARQGQLILSRIDARNGAIGIVPASLDGSVVSNDFPLFQIDNNLVLPQYLEWLSKTKSFVELCRKASEGTTNRVRLQEHRFLGLQLSFPPLPEQRRIVARIEELAAKINEARGFRKKAAEAAEALVLSLLHRLFVEGSSGWQPLPMENAIEISDRQVNPTLPEYINLPHISGENMQSKTCRLLPWRTADEDGVKSNNYLFGPGTVLYSKIRPYLRKVVFVDFAGICSADVYPIRISSPEIDPHFLKWTLVAEPFTDYANRLSGRTRMPKLNRKQLFGFNLKRPSLPDQHRIVLELEAAQSKVDAVKKLQAKTAAELDALLPSILDRAFKGEL